MKNVLPTVDCLLKIISCSCKKIVQPIIGVLSFIINKSDAFFNDLFIGAYDKVTFVELFKSSHHQNTDGYPFSA